MVLIAEDGRKIHVWGGDESDEPKLVRGSVHLSHSMTDPKGAVLHDEAPNISKLLCNMNDTLLL